MSNLVLASSNLSPQEAIAQLDRVREFVKSETDPTVLAETIDRAKLAASWVKIKSAAGEVTLHATKVQVTAVRRIGQLGSEAVQLLSKRDGEYACLLAKLTDARFEAELDNLDRSIGPASFYRNIYDSDVRAWDLNRGYDIAHGKPNEGISERQAIALAWEEKQRLADLKPKTKARIERELRDQTTRERNDRADNDTRIHLMNQLLDRLYQDGDPFSVSDATDSMIEALNRFIEDDPDQILSEGDPRKFSPEGPTSNYVREGVAAAIRHALATASSSDDCGSGPIKTTDGKKVYPPKFVTYFDPDAGWVRIPWETASLVQLREMEELRRKQAEDLAAKALSLTLLVSELDKRHEQNPDQTRCEWLLTDARKAHARADPTALTNISDVRVAS